MLDLGHPVRMELYDAIKAEKIGAWIARNEALLGTVPAWRWWRRRRLARGLAMARMAQAAYVSGLATGVVEVGRVIGTIVERKHEPVPFRAVAPRSMN